LQGRDGGVRQELAGRTLAARPNPARCALSSVTSCHAASKLSPYPMPAPGLKNPAAPAVKREAEEDWGGEQITGRTASTRCIVQQAHECCLARL
jgi:hypothetical protein